MLISFGIVFLANLKNANEINGPQVKSDRLLAVAHAGDTDHAPRNITKFIIQPPLIPDIHISGYEALDFVHYAASKSSVTFAVSGWDWQART